MLGPEPVNGYTVFSDRDDVDLSWLAGFVYKTTDKRGLILMETHRTLLSYCGTDGKSISF